MAREINVLLVDDKPTVRNTIKNVLKIASPTYTCKFEEAMSGEDALEAVRQKDFDIVILDMKLPGINGIETLKEMRKLTEHKLGRVIVLTGSIELENESEAIRLGAFQYLTKDPIDFDKLKGAFEAALQ